MAIPPSQSGLVKFTTEPFVYTGTEGDEETEILQCCLNSFESALYENAK